MRVGFIGLGSQGAPMAGRIAEAGFPTTLWARRPASLEPFAGSAATVAGSPAELAAASDLVCLCVVGDADVLEVATGENGVLAGLEPGGVIAIHSTVHPNTCDELAEQAAAQGVSVIDAPVSGGAPAVAEGRLLVMIGGDEDVVEQCRPVFASYGDPIVHLGALGSGQTTKLLNNLLFTANLGTAATTLALGEALGISPERLTEVISRGSGNSFALNVLGGDTAGLARLAGMAGALLQKDVRLLADVAESKSVAGGTVLDTADATLSLMEHPR
jgi:3-hydroxyisobutyrate dehydrogenase